MKIQIHETKLPNGKLAILVGGLNSETPQQEMDAAVIRYIGSEPHVVFVDSHLDNPWIRVIITGLNDLEFNEQDI